MDQQMDNNVASLNKETANKQSHKDIEVSFEQALAELERVVQRMQNPDCSLDEALSLFVRGSELTKLCHGKLAEVEAKITLLTENAQGELREEEQNIQL